MKFNSNLCLFLTLQILLSCQTRVIQQKENELEYNCYWMENYSGRFEWIPAENSFSQKECYELDSCDGGLGHSEGGCYKWATSASASAIPWKDINQTQE